MNKLILFGVLFVGLIAGLSIYTRNYDVFNVNKDNSGNTVISSDFLSMRPAISALQFQELSIVEKEGLLYMREEEKLARDVYMALYEKWRINVFSNIAQSEQTHTESVRQLLVKYSISDPIVDDSIGVFVNPILKKLYTDLTAQGLKSVEDALTVGAIIEDLDISDLKKYISETDNDDLKLVYENLTRGSRNHLRAFTSQLKSRGVTYVPRYITQDEYNQIISSGTETGISNSGGRGWGRK